MARPPYIPGRTDLPLNQQGNPLYPGPNLAPPGWNPGGLLPAVVTPRGLERWGDRRPAKFELIAGTRVWTYETVVLDLRPGGTQADGAGVRAVPVNHEAALGAGVYLTVLVSGKTPPAAIPGMTVSYIELGNNIGQDMKTLSQAADITDLIQGGGTSLVDPVGASMLNFTPSQPGLRFWKIAITFTINTSSPVNAYGIFCQAATN
jgi:hypothetical protein